MVTNRRGALLAIVFAVFGRAGRGSTSVTGLEPNPNWDSLETQGADVAEVRLRENLNRLAGRVYSEEGIPMVLACENLVPGQSSFVPTALNKNLSDAFARDTRAYQHMKPDAASADIAKIIEMLADRDFAAGGIEKTL